MRCTSFISLFGIVGQAPVPVDPTQFDIQLDANTFFHVSRDIADVSRGHCIEPPESINCDAQKFYVLINTPAALDRICNRELTFCITQQKKEPRTTTMTVNKPDAIRYIGAACIALNLFDEAAKVYTTAFRTISSVNTELAVKSKHLFDLAARYAQYALQVFDHADEDTRISSINICDSEMMNFVFETSHICGTVVSICLKHEVPSSDILRMHQFAMRDTSKTACIQNFDTDDFRQNCIAVIMKCLISNKYPDIMQQIQEKTGLSESNLHKQFWKFISCQDITMSLSQAALSAASNLNSAFMAISMDVADKEYMKDDNPETPKQKKQTYLLSPPSLTGIDSVTDMF